MKSLNRLPAIARGLLVAGAVAAGTPLSAAADAADVPSAQDQETLIKTSLMTFNDANITANYGVMLAKMAQPFREQFTAEKLQGIFKTFAEKHVDFGAIVTMKPVMSEPARIDERGALLLHGYFDIQPPTQVAFTLDYVPSEAQWKLININVYIGPPKDNAGKPANPQ